VYKDKCRTFFGRITDECKKAFHVIVRVFPAPSSVMVQILNRVFEERIKPFIHEAVSRNSEIGDNLRILEEAHLQTSSTSDRLYALKQAAMKTFMESEIGQHRGIDPAANSLLDYHGLSLARGSIVGIAADDTSSSSNSRPFNLRGAADGKEDFKFRENVKAIFDSFRGNYLDKEVSLLREECSSIIGEAIELDEKQREELDDKSIFGRRKKGTKGSRALKHWVLTALDALAVAGAPPSSPMFNGRKEKGKIAGQVTERVLGRLSSALARADRLGNQVPQCCDQLAKEAWNLLLSEYVAKVLDLAEQVLPDDDPKEDPDTFFFLRVVGAVNRIVRQINAHYRLNILPRLEADPNIKSRGASANRKALSTIEKRILRGLGICLGAVIKYAERLLGKHQKQSDFKPRDENDCFEPTEACNIVSGFIAVQGEMAVQSLEGRNLDVFLMEIGRRYYDLLIAHLRKFQVSPLGALVVRLDVRRYQDVMQEFHIEQVSRKFSCLWEMSSLLLLPVLELGNVVQQRLGNVPKEELHDFLKSRSDYAKQRINILSLLNI